MNETLSGPGGNPVERNFDRRSFFENRPSDSDKIARAKQLLSRGLLDQAQALAELELANDNRCADAHSLIANILDRRGEWQDSLTHLRQAFELMPEAPQLRLNLAMALLRLGDYREGLALYEARIAKPTWSGFATIESRDANRDRLLRAGEQVEGRRILLLAEQGLGDGIMCARYIPMLAQQGARIALASNPTLRPFFARMPGIETLLSPPFDQPFAQINLAALPFDAWLPLLSLPFWFGTGFPNVPADIPYWAADETLVADWRNRLAAAGRAGMPKVGVIFQANPGGPGFADKSMQVADLMPLLSLSGIDVVNLQYGPAAREVVGASPGVIDPLPADLPLDEYGAVLAATDLVIAVDTMAAHFAGALGHARWAAVPHSPHWIWGLGGATTPWYPLARIFRQERNRDWSGAVAAIARELTGRFGTAHVVRHGIGVPDRASPLANSVLQERKKKQAPSVSANSITSAKNLAGSEMAQFELGIMQLLRGEFEPGFANFEARQSVPIWSDQALPLAESLLAVRERRLRPGDSLRGRHIAVFTEQGLGDTFFGARFLATLAERGATITLVCHAPMRPFFARLSCVNAILSPPDEAPHAKIDLRKLSFDAFCPLLSLPRVLGIAREATPPSGPYLSADPGQVATWRARYERQGHPGQRKVGLVWQANPTNVALSDRSVRVQDLAPLGAIEGVDFVNLQYGLAGRELVRLAPEAIDIMQAPLTLDEFAAALAATDLVVSVDTMAAHCAGALGHSVWVMLTDYPAWYWGLERGDCRWYRSARLFRRGTGSGWSDTIEAVAAALRTDERKK
jgi:hypothetical protein